MVTQVLQMAVAAAWKGALPALLAVIMVLLIHRWQRFRVLQNLGYCVPPYSFLTGNAGKLFGRSGLTGARQLFSEYGVQYGDRGRTMAVYIGAKPQIWTTDPDLINDICVKMADTFQDRTNTAKNPLYDLINHSLLTLKGARWKHVRSVLNPAFTSAKLRGMAPLMSDSICTFMELLEEDRLVGRATDVYSGYQRLTLEVICRTILAMDVRCQRDMQSPLVRTISALAAATPLMHRLRQLQPITRLLRPLLRTFGATGRATQHAKVMDGWLRDVVARREAAAGSGGPAARDVLQLLLDARRADLPAANRAPLSEDELISNAFFSVAAGRGTTSAALAFTTYLLADHPAVQERLAAEIAEYMPDCPDGDLDCERVLTLPYLDMVVQESLRIFPPTPGAFNREVSRACEVRGVRLPAGAAVGVSVFCLHREPALWPQPETFDPERFSAANRARLVPGSHLPFGLGPRHCIGSRFALMEVKLALCTLLKKYRLLPPEEEVVPVLKEPTLAPASGKIELRVELRD